MCVRQLPSPIAPNILSVLGRFKNTLGPLIFIVESKAQLCTFLTLPHFIHLVIPEMCPSGFSLCPKHPYITHSKIYSR